MPGMRASRSAISARVIALGVVVVILVAGAGGYLLLLRPGSASSSGQTSSGGVASGPGSTQQSPVSAFALYNDYNLGGNATDYPQFTNHLIYAKGNITSIVRDPSTGGAETQLATGANQFEYWDWPNATELPVFADNQAVLAHCFVKGLAPSQNGTAYLYLTNCSLISIQGSKSGT